MQFLLLVISLIAYFDIVIGQVVVNEWNISSFNGSGLDMYFDAQYLNPNINSALILNQERGETGQGSAYFNVELGPDSSFSTYFNFTITDASSMGDDDGGGGDGLAFIITGAYSRQVYNEDLTFQTLPVSLGVEFDTYKHEDISISDPDGNHIGINFNGDMHSVATFSVAERMNDGYPNYAWVDYNGATQVLEVRYATGYTRPSSPQISFITNLTDILQAPQGLKRDGYQLYTGFGASVNLPSLNLGGPQAITESHIVSAWSFRNRYEPYGVPVCGNGMIDIGEDCDGGVCCSLNCTFINSTVICRSAVDVCDVAETCTGSSSTCPVDDFAPDGTKCRGAVAECDQEEVCNGTSVECPPDLALPADVVCRPQYSPCDIEDYCLGNSSYCPADQFVEQAGVVCRPLYGPCDVEEVCPGGSPYCPPDEFEPAFSSMCRPAVDICDIGEYCSGNSAACPGDLYAPSTEVCRLSYAFCDVEEYCTGISTDCPTDRDNCSPPPDSSSSLTTGRVEEVSVVTTGTRRPVTTSALTTSPMIVTTGAEIKAAPIIRAPPSSKGKLSTGGKIALAVLLSAAGILLAVLAFVFHRLARSGEQEEV